MLIRTILKCWLCRNPYDLILTVFDGTRLGSPRFWCRSCTSRPAVFARLLHKRIAELEAASVQFVDEEIALINQLLARQAAIAR